MDAIKLADELLSLMQNEFNYVTVGGPAMKKERLRSLCVAVKELYSEVEFLEGCLASDQIVAINSGRQMLKKWGED